MSPGTLTLACLLLTAGQVPSDVWYTNQKNFKVPIDIRPAQRQKLSQLLLYVSDDQGRSWHQQASVTSDKDAFLFYAPNDGQYWLRVAAQDLKGVQEPADISRGPPDQKILIDTVRPVVRIVSAQRQGEDVVVAWEIQEEHPDWTSLKLEYRSLDGSATWALAPLEPTAKGQKAIRIPGTGAVALKLSIKDLADNASFAEAEVPATGVQVAANFAPSPAPPPPPVVTPPATTNVPPPVLTSDAKWQAPPPPPPTEHLAPPPAAQGAFAPSPAAMERGAPLPPVINNSTFPPAPTPAPRPEPPAGRVVASTQALVAPETPAPTVASSPTTSAVRRPLPAVQIVNQSEVTLEYEIAKAGPSGIGKVELYLTTNDGQTWTLFAEDPDVKQPTVGSRYQRRVELPGEGVYGLSLVVKNKAGMGKPPPKPGDPPEMRIEVDKTPPEAMLFAPEPDPQRRDALILSWVAKDRNLAANPITLEWAERRDGIWHVIGQSLSNTTSRYSWQVPPGVPYKVFLRLRVRDLAGNENIACTSEEQLIDMSTPEVSHIGLVSATATGQRR
jgi:hypothetical protein